MMYKGITCVLLAAIFWGTGGVTGQFLYTNYGVDPVWLVMVRQIVAGSLFLAYSKLYLKDSVIPILKEFPWSILIFSFPIIFLIGFYTILYLILKEGERTIKNVREHFNNDNS